jgi:hypothetical protein
VRGIVLGRTGVRSIKRRVLLAPSTVINYTLITKAMVVEYTRGTLAMRGQYTVDRWCKIRQLDLNRHTECGKQ